MENEGEGVLCINITIMLGLNPRTQGIIDNNWISLKRGQRFECVTDEQIGRWELGIIIKTILWHGRKVKSTERQGIIDFLEGCLKWRIEEIIVLRCWKIETAGR